MLAEESDGRSNIRRNNVVKAGFSILIILLSLTTLSASQQQSQEPQTFLRNYLGFSRDQVLQVEHGAVVARVLKRKKHEVAAVAVTRIHVPQDFFVARFRDIERHKKSEAVLQVRKFNAPAQANDLRELILTSKEVNDLQKCRPGLCNFKLSARMIRVLHQQIDFSGPNRVEQAAAAMRNLLADYAQDYMADGNKLMIEYDDKPQAVQSAKEFAALLEGSPYLMKYAPEFRGYLANFPDTTLAGVENFLYWSRENYGHDLRPVLTLTAASIYQRSSGQNPRVLIASKQIYASHYFEASLGLTMLFEPMPADHSPSFYLVYVNRSRIDLLRKWYSIFGRERLSQSVRSSMRRNMAEVRSRVEIEYRETQEPHNRQR